MTLLYLRINDSASLIILINISFHNNKFLPKYVSLARFMFLITVLLKFQVLSDVPLCHWKSSSTHFKTSKCLLLQGQTVKVFMDEGSIPLQSGRNYLPNNTESRLTILEYCGFLLSVSFHKHSISILH